MKILLTNILPADEFRAPLGTAFLKAYALQRPDLQGQVEIIIKHFNTRDTFEAMIDQIDKVRPDVIGCSCFVWNFNEVSHLLNYVRAILPKAHIILGGPEVSPIAEKVLEQNKAVDIIVCGDGEEPFTKISRNLLTGVPEKKDIKGIAFRHKDKIVMTPPEHSLDNLDEIPSIYLSNLVPEIKEAGPSKVLYETSRGCIYKCHYCYYYRYQKRGIRTYSMERIENELLYFMENELERVSLVDSLMNFDNRRMFRILNFILNNNRKTKFELEICAELLNAQNIDLLNKLAKARALFRVDIGLQSIHLEVLNKINRPLDLKRFFKNISLFEPALKNVTSIDLIYGLPGDDYAGFKESLEYLLQNLGIAFIQYTMLQVLPGTWLYDNARKFDLIFDPLPPHYIYSNHTYSYNDTFRSSSLVNAFEVLFGSFTQRATAILVKKLKIKFVDIFEKFVLWEEEHPQIFANNKYTYNQLKQFFEETCIQGGHHDLLISIREVLYNDYCCYMASLHKITQ